MKDDNGLDQILSEVKIPKMVKVQQEFSRNSIAKSQIKAHVYSQLSQPKFKNTIIAGKNICITAGSRGICNIVEILKSIVCFCKEQGANPFLVAAMGSHAGATGDGQREMLEHLGITEKAVGCSILSSMETVLLGHTDSGFPVYIDKNAYESDGIIVCGRVKLHTAFRGKFESGIIKMMTIGLGKQKGASTCHSAGYSLFPKMLPEIAFKMLEKAPVLFGIAIVENAFDETDNIVALTPDEFKTEEPKLLKEAASKMASIMVESCDVLIIDEMGKNISGEGSDPNIAGTFCVTTATGGIKADKRACLNLTPVSGGNALGIGGLDVITRRLFDSINISAMYPNVVTTHEFGFGKIPLIANNDEQAFKMCLYGSNALDPKKAKVVRIKNTLELSEIFVSEALIDEIKANKKLHQIGGLVDFEFDKKGGMLTKF